MSLLISNTDVWQPEDSCDSSRYLHNLADSESKGCSVPIRSFVGLVSLTSGWPGFKVVGISRLRTSTMLAL